MMQQLTAELICDLDHAGQLLADLDAADRDGNIAGAAIARGQLSIALDWMRDRLGHAGGAPCFFEPHTEYCPLVFAGPVNHTGRPAVPAATLAVRDGR